MEMRQLDMSRLSFLIVDDNAHMRSTIRQVLSSFGARDLHEASDGADAMDAMSARVPDVMLTDRSMSPVDGIELVRWMRRSKDSPNAFMPIVMVTAYSERFRICEARDAGINEVLVKPFSAAKLYEKIWLVVDRPRPFVRTKTYFGPDRRRHNDPNYRGPERRQQDPAKTVQIQPGATEPEIAPDVLPALAKADPLTCEAALQAPA